SVLNLDARRWTTLPRPPTACSGLPAVAWTGAAVLVLCGESTRGGAGLAWVAKPQTDDASASIARWTVPITRQEAEAKVAALGAVPKDAVLHSKLVSAGELEAAGAYGGTIPHGQQPDTRIWFVVASGR